MGTRTSVDKLDPGADLGAPQMPIGVLDSRLAIEHQALVDASLMFTDLVGSTERLAMLGDVRWKALLDHYYAEIQLAVAYNGGVVITTTGDGVLATFLSADRALCAAQRIRQGFAADGLGIRVGVHVGDVERRGDDVAGIAVHIAARVMSLAEAGEVLVTGSVPIAAAGSSHEFEDAGDHTLKGVPGVWPLFRTL